MKTSQGQVEQTKGEVLQENKMINGSYRCTSIWSSPTFNQFDNLYGGTTKFGVPHGVDQSVKINHSKVC